MSQSLILIDILSSVFSGKEKTKKKRKGHLARRLFHPWPDMPCWLCCMGFLWLLSAING
jgi:hypothetical protein